MIFQKGVRLELFGNVFGNGSGSGRRVRAPCSASIAPLSGQLYTGRRFWHYSTGGKMKLSRLAAFGLALTLAQPAFAQQKVFRVTPHSNLTILDPIWTTAYMSRNHGYMIYDTLFAMDEKSIVRPQMVDKYTVSPDKKTWTFTLRDGLVFHDNKPVTSDDCIASIKRWGTRDSMGIKMLSFVDKWEAVDAKTFKMILKEPYGLVLDSLGKPSSNVPFIMPKRFADTAGD